MIAAFKFDYAWIYVAGPLLGAAVAAAVLWLLYGEPSDSENEAAHGRA